MMSEQVVLITGALTGIGRAAAVGVAPEGAHVVVCGGRAEAGPAPPTAAVAPETTAVA